MTTNGSFLFQIQTVFLLQTLSPSHGASIVECSIPDEMIGMEEGSSCNLDWRHDDCRRLFLMAALSYFKLCLSIANSVSKSRHQFQGFNIASHVWWSVSNLQACICSFKLPHVASNLPSNTVAAIRWMLGELSDNICSKMQHRWIAPAEQSL